jgi:hypothetical protein
MGKELYDIEVYKNFFCVGIKDFLTKEIIFYEISEEKNNLDLIYNWFKNYNGFLVGFNSIHYDNMIIKYLLNNYEKYKNLNYIDVTLDLKYFSDKIIDGEFDEEIKRIKYMKTNWTDIDLFLYWSKMLRISKKISLKSLGIQLGYHTVQELPYKPDTILTIKDLPKLRYYNYTHDLGILELLLIKMEEEVKLRAYIKQEYNLECWSMDAPKIASEYLLEYYCQNTYNSSIKDNNFESYWKYKKRIRDNRYEPSVWNIGDYIPKVNFKTKFFQDIYNEILKAKSNDKISLILPFFQKNHSLMLSISQGGIHSVNNNQSYLEDNDYYIIDADIAGLYPTLFRKYKFLRKELHIILEKYVQMIDDRTIAKRNGDKKKDTFLKLCNNAFSGLVDSNVTWLYSPEHILALRIFGQLIQLRFMEELNFHDIEILFTNTDGTLVRCPKDKINIYHEIANKIANEFQVEWEFALINKIYFANTNTYISLIKEEYMIDSEINKINVKQEGKIKKKGKYFKYDKDIPLGDSVDEQIIAKALEAYYVNNIKPEEFIKNPDKYNLHIYDYCKSNKIGKDFIVYWNGEIQQQLNRYYFSKKGAYLFKQKHGQGTMQHVNAGQPVVLFNNYENKNWSEYNINYQYYISATQKIIDEINKYNQLTLF